MIKYHINPETGEPGKCTAKEGNCLYGESSPHFSTPEDARTAYEAAQGGAFLSTKQKINITKADIKKLTTPRVDLNIYLNPENLLVHSAYLRMRDLRFDAANKLASIKKINELLDYVHSERYTKTGLSALRARLSYDAMAKELEKFGFKRAPLDAGDKLIKEQFTLDISDAINNKRTLEELEDDLAKVKERERVFNKPLQEITDEELEKHLTYIKAEDPNLRYRGDPGALEGFIKRRENLIRADKLEKISEIWDTISPEERGKLKLPELKQEIERLRKEKTFPLSYYYTRRMVSPLETPSPEELIKSASRTAPISTKRAKRFVENHKKMISFLEELDRVSKK